MKSTIRFLLFVLAILFLYISVASAQYPVTFNSYQSGNWNDLNTWEMYDSLGQYNYPALYIPTTNEYINILSGHTVNITANVTVDSVFVDTLATLIVDTGVAVSAAPSENYSIGVLGTLSMNGTLINAGIVATGSVGTITVNGTLSNLGIVWPGSAGSIRITPGGIYEHAQNGGFIPGVIWDSLSTCKVTGYVGGSKPGNGNQNYYNYEWDCPNQGTNIDLGWYNNTIRGNITVKRTGTASYQLRMTSPSPGPVNTITVLGDILVEGGQFTSNGSSGSADITVNHYGNIYLTGGIFSISKGSGPNVLWNLYGNFTINGNVILTASGNSKLVFAKSGTQILSWIGSVQYTGDLNYEIAPACTLQLATDWNVSNLFMAGGIIDLNGNILAYDMFRNTILTYNASSAQITSDIEFPSVNGPKNLVLGNSVGITIHSPRVVSNTLIIGGNGSYSNLSNISGFTSVGYAASIHQTTGPELPSTVTNLIINNINDVTLSTPVQVSGRLTFTSGKLLLGDNNIEVLNMSGASPSSYVVIDGTGNLTVENIGTNPVVIPVGLASSYNPVTIDNTQGTVDNFTVRVDSGVYDPSKCDSSYAVQRTWTIAKDGVHTKNIKLGFQWNEGEAGSNMTSTKVVWRYDTSWTQVGSCGPWTNSGTTYSFLGTVGSLLSPIYFTVGDTGIVPIQVIPPDVIPPPMYVSLSGNDADSGSFAFPYRTLAKALSMAVPGSMIYLRGGIYVDSMTVQIPNIGLGGYTITVWAYPGETPIFDFTPQPKSNQAHDDGINISGNYIHIKGIEVKNAGHNGIYITGRGNIIENCSTHDNTNTGIHIRGVGASDNLVLNCDSYFNFDPPGGGDADGFSAKWEIGSGNVFRGCRSYNNSDDGWDLWMADHLVVIDSCWSFRNGIDSWHTGYVNGNGNGFKLGGASVATPNIVQNCLAFDNAGNGGKGFDENNNLAGQTLYNCTSFRNTGSNYSLPNTVTQGEHVVKNCISYLGGVNITSGIQDHNSWQGFVVTDNDFVSFDTVQVLGPRKLDGNLPDITFLHLSSGSSMIDAGVNVGLPYNYAAPDLGCFEYSTGQSIADRTELTVPASFQLLQNYPNPFNPSTQIEFSVPSNGRTILKIFNILGQEIVTLFDEVAISGQRYRKTFNASNLPSGMYFSVLRHGNKQLVQKMVLMK